MEPELLATHEAANPPDEAENQPDGEFRTRPLDERGTQALRTRHPSPQDEAHSGRGISVRKTSGRGIPRLRTRHPKTSGRGTSRPPDEAPQDLRTRHPKTSGRGTEALSGRGKMASGRLRIAPAAQPKHSHTFGGWKKARRTRAPTLGRKKPRRARRSSSAMTKMFGSRRDVISGQRIKSFHRRKPYRRCNPPFQRPMDFNGRKGRGQHKRTAGRRHAHSRVTHDGDSKEKTADGHATWTVTHPADSDRDSAKKTVDGHASRTATHPADTFQEPGQGTQESGSSRREVVGVYGTSKPEAEARKPTSSFPLCDKVK